METLHRYATIEKMFSFKIDKLSTTHNILNGKPCDVLYTGYLNKDISFGDIVYFEPKNIQYKKLVNGVIDQLKVSLIDGDGNEISIARQKVSKVCYSFLQKKEVPLNSIEILKNSLTLK